MDVGKKKQAAGQQKKLQELMDFCKTGLCLMISILSVLAELILLMALTFLNRQWGL